MHRMIPSNCLQLENDFISRTQLEKYAIEFSKKHYFPNDKDGNFHSGIVIETTLRNVILSELIVSVDRNVRLIVKNRLYIVILQRCMIM